jgi:hypothetical protein
MNAALKFDTAQVKVVAQTWGGEKIAGRAALTYETFTGALALPLAALNLPEGADFPPQIDLHDGEGGLARFSLLRCHGAAPHAWGEYRSGATTLLVKQAP